ncbi:uncharacterized protein TNCV_3384611 [Trichonephila clavipes]|uniref:Uncharacterized protein n=1 Tax=Trichonephila clavipes TaxID=2585209 RepID=A0A8X6SUL0_TRICX|nr:uncharacterized protein TNCV_3384611 [Trichonephila clavipes]
MVLSYTGVQNLGNNVKIKRISMKLQKRRSGDQYSEHKTFQTTGTAVRKVGGGSPRTTTAGDDRYIILQTKRGRRQSAKAPLLSNSLQQRGDKCRGFTVARRLHKGPIHPAILNSASC